MNGLHVLFSGQMMIFQWQYSSSTFKSLLQIKLKLYFKAFCLGPVIKIDSCQLDDGEDIT